jgi:hypothetical protein
MKRGLPMQSGAASMRHWVMDDENRSELRHIKQERELVLSNENHLQWPTGA